MISRSNMSSQLWGNKTMKKKSKKMAVGGELIKSLSPAYNLATGKGALADIAASGLLGAIPYGVAKNRKKIDAKKKKGDQSLGEGVSGVSGVGSIGMKQGGSVKKKRDGICVKGKTKGRMV